MLKSFTRILSISAVAVASLTASAAAPGQPDLSVVYELSGERGVVTGSVTAPLTDMNQKALPDDATLSLAVYRSAYSLGQNNLVVARFDGVMPGESRTFTDGVVPEWQFNEDYTYTAFVKLDGYEFWQGYAGMKPGLDFMFPKNALTLTPALEGATVTMSVIAPSQMTSGYPLEEPLKSLEFYRATDVSQWPYKYEKLYEYASPEYGEVVTYTDNSANLDAENYYKVRAVTQYGYTETYNSCYVGLDVPAAPYPVTAEEKAEGVVVSWTAPDHGENWGAIDPDNIWYNVYRCWDYGSANRELIAERITGTTFVDKGADLPEPKDVRYEVQAGNSKGPGGSNYSSSGFDIIVGPAYALPFRETFDGGLTKIWSMESTNYYARWYVATEAEYGDRPVKTVKPVQGTGLAYVDYVYNSPDPGTVNTLTSYKIALDGATNPYVSFWYYAIPDNDVEISVAASDERSSFGDANQFRISNDVTEPEWRKVWAPLSDVAGKDVAYLRFLTTYHNDPSSAIIDDVEVLDYPTVSNLEAMPDDENLSVMLTWNLGDYGVAECKGFVGYVNGVEKGEVTSPWVYEGLERDKVYTFQVRPLYEGVEVDASPACGVLIKTPSPDHFTVGDYDYSVVETETDSADMMAVITGYHGKGGLLRLPTDVSFDEVTYKITGIAEDSFAGLTSIESVAIPEGYFYIGRAAFKGDTSLEALSIPASMFTISDEAFSGCSALVSVNFAGTVPPSVGKDAFAGIADGCKGRCPAGSEEAYANEENLSAIDFGIEVNGIDSLLENPEVKAEYFDILGRRLKGIPVGQTYVLRLTLPDGSTRTVKRL